MIKLLLTTVLALNLIAVPVMAADPVGVDLPSQQAAPTPISDDFRYDIKYWSPELLAIIEHGPKILPKDMAITLKPFPANTSAETVAELAALKTFAEEERTIEQQEKIQQEIRPMPLHRVFSDNGLYDLDTHPITNSLLVTVDGEVSYFILREKKAIQRPRPTQLMPELTTLFKVPPHSAYPSGHAGQFYAVALMLAEVDPANAEKYKQLAVDIGHRREIAGVHYPSDSEAGRELATQVVAALLKDADIQKRLALAKKEFEIAH